MKRYAVVLVTCESVREAKRLAGALLNNKLIACANIINAVESYFWWKGKINTAKESLLLLKTKKSLVQKVEKEILRLHRYEVPEIIAFPIDSGNERYLAWIEDSCR